MNRRTPLLSWSAAWLAVVGSLLSLTPAVDARLRLSLAMPVEQDAENDTHPCGSETTHIKADALRPAHESQRRGQRRAPFPVTGRSLSATLALHSCTPTPKGGNHRLAPDVPLRC